MKTIIIDLDGTICDIRQRLHYISDGISEWDKFYLACDKDEPIKPTILVVQSIYKRNPHIKPIIITGRSDIAKSATIAWLNKNKVPFYGIYMRKQGDFTEDHILKKRLLREFIADYNQISNHSGVSILFALEDRQSCVDMWKEEGIPVLQPHIPGMDNNF